MLLAEGLNFPQGRHTLQRLCHVLCNVVHCCRHRHAKNITRSVDNFASPLHQIRVIGLQEKKFKKGMFVYV